LYLLFLAETGNFFGLCAVFKDCICRREFEVKLVNDRREKGELEKLPGLSEKWGSLAAGSGRETQLPLACT